jgi:hypothetical protein
VFDIGAIARAIRHRLLFAFNTWPLFPRVNEDVFWGMLISRKASFFTVPGAIEAVPFAFDNEPRYLYELNGERLPFACHAWERFDLAFWQSTLQKQGIDLGLPNHLTDSASSSTTTYPQ